MRYKSNIYNKFQFNLMSLDDNRIFLFQLIDNFSNNKINDNPAATLTAGGGDDLNTALDASENSSQKTGTPSI